MLTDRTLLFSGKRDGRGGVFGRVSASQADWQYINMVGLRLNKDDKFDIAIDDYEYVAVVLSGRCNIRTNRAEFTDIGYRPDVFRGLPYAIYLPRQTDFEIEALTDGLEIVSCWVPTTQDHPIELIQPGDIKTEIIGNDHASYQRNIIVPASFSAHRLMVYETYTPSGNWSPYPAQRYTNPLEHLTFLRFDRPHGYAIQRLYTSEEERLLTAQENDVVIAPEGYRTTVSGYGYATYGLHFVAGDSRNLDAEDDQRQAWLQDLPQVHDPRLPLVDRGMMPGD